VKEIIQVFTNKYKVFLTDINTWFVCYWTAHSFDFKQLENAAGNRNLLTTSSLSENKKLKALSTRL